MADFKYIISKPQAVLLQESLYNPCLVKKTHTLESVSVWYKGTVEDCINGLYENSKP